jgi:DNA polymerase I
MTQADLFGKAENDAAEVLEKKPKKKAPELGCSTCPLSHKKKVLPSGDLGACKLVIVTHEPTRDEEAEGGYLTFGPAAERLWKELRAIGLSVADCYITAPVKCRADGDAKPDAKAKRNCLVQFQEEWAAIKGKTILALGAEASRFLTAKAGEKTWGTIFSDDRGNSILPVIHPSALLYSENEGRLVSWRRQLKLLLPIIAKGTVKPRVEFTLINTPSGLEDMKNYLLGSEAIAIDIETNGTEAWRPLAKILTIALSDGERTFVVDWESLGDVATEPLREILECPSIGKIAQNAKFEAVWLRRQKGIMIYPWVGDPSLARFLLDEGAGTSTALKQMVWRYFPEYGGYEEGIDMANIAALNRDRLFLYNATDALLTMRLHNILSQELEVEGMAYVMDTVVLPAINPLSEMEAIGLKLDLPALEAERKKLETEMDSALAQVLAFDTVKKVEGFRITAPGDLRKLFYEVLGKTPKEKTPKGQDALTADDLERFDREGLPEAQAILSYKRSQKIISTYITNYINGSDQDGFLFPSYYMNVARSGRLSSGNPNIQNVPPDIRRVFISRFEDQGLLLQADFKQIEVRVIAVESDDKRLLDIFREGKDPYLAVASQILGIPEDKVARDQRQAAKVVVLGMLYGMSPKTLAERERMPVEKATFFYNGFFNTFNGVKRWQAAQKRKADAGEKIVSKLGRRRDISMFFEDERVRRAYNFPIQSAASDLNLFSIGLVWELMRKENLKSVLIATVHDSLLVDAYAPELPVIRDIIGRVVEFIPQVFPWVTCPMTIDISEGANWKEAK